MVLNDYREQADVVLLPIAKRIQWISPNTLTYLSLVLAGLSGLSYALTDRSDDYLLLAFLLLFFSSLFDGLDGKVARLTNRSSAKGDLLDHVFDRYSDIFILGGITFSPYCPMEIGFIAIISVLMLSYMGTQAQAVGGKRHYGGWLGRADRLMLLLVASMVQYILIVFFSTHEISSFYLLGWLMILFIFVGNLNAFQRLYDTWKELSREPLKEKVAGAETDDTIEWEGE